MRSGQRESNSGDARSICDALQVAAPGKLTFAIMTELMGDGLSVSDEQVREAIRFGFTNLKMVIEPGGAAALAALLAGKIDASGKTTVVVISGGNVDPGLFASIQQGGDASPGSAAGPSRTSASETA